MLVRDLNPDERPLARLEKHGAETLSNADLLSIIFGGQTSLRAARYALRHGLSDLPKSSKDPQIAPIRRARISALLELSRRLVAHDEPPARQLATTDGIAKRYMLSLGHEEQEHCGVILLDNRNCIIEEHELFVGTINNALVSTREIIKTALRANATSLILYHNHPSGNPSPSDDDLRMTAKLKTAAETMDVQLVDHIIVGRYRYYSFHDHGHL